MPGAPELPAEVTVGVRPEAARVWRDDEDLLGRLRGQVEYVEALGRKTFVGVEAGGVQSSRITTDRLRSCLGTRSISGWCRRTSASSERTTVSRSGPGT